MKRFRGWPWVCLIVLLFELVLAGQNDAVKPNENLVAEGIPQIPASLAESAERYNNFRGANLVSWHPERREMLIATRFADVPEIHLVKMPGGDRRQLTFFPDAVGSAHFNPKHGNYFVFSKDVGGGEFYQLYRDDPESGEITLLTDGKSRNTGLVWARAGDKIAYGSTRRDGRDVDLWVMDPGKPATDHLLAKLDGGGWQALDWSRDEQKLLVLSEISAQESYLWLMDGTTGEKTLLTPKGDVNVHYAGGQFSKDSQGIYLLTDKDSEFHRLAYLDLRSRRHTYLTTPIPWDIDDFDLSDDGKLLAFVANEDGYGVLHVMDTATGKERPLPTLPKGVVDAIAWHKNSRDLGFTLSSARSSADVYSLDIENGKVERWTFSETGGLNTADFSEPELIHWKSWDGRLISGFLYRPATKFTGKRPVIVNIHGGPEGQFRPSFIGRSNFYLRERP